MMMIEVMMMVIMQTGDDHIDDDHDDHSDDDHDDHSDDDHSDDDDYYLYK